MANRFQHVNCKEMTSIPIASPRSEPATRWRLLWKIAVAAAGTVLLRPLCFWLSRPLLVLQSATWSSMSRRAYRYRLA